MRRTLGCLVALPLLGCAAPAWAVGGLMVRCNIADAEVWLDGHRLGPCPGQFTPTPGIAQLVVRKDKDFETEWYWAGEVRLKDDQITQVDAQLKEHRTQLGMQREMERHEKARREEEALREEKQRQAQARRQEEWRQEYARWEEKQRLTAPRAEQLSGEFVTIKGGDFQMGCVYWDRWLRITEGPVHQVHVNDFKLAKYEVTQWQWRQVMGSNPSFFGDCGNDCPVENMSFDDIQTFIAKLNAQTGKHFHLPTEAEWEYACRSGGKQQQYCGGDDLDALAWDGWNSEHKTHPVGGKQANGLGIYDMSGNVWEWTCSEFQFRYGGSEKECAPGADFRVLRGGGWSVRTCSHAGAWEPDEGSRSRVLGEPQTDVVEAKAGSGRKAVRRACFLRKAAIATRCASGRWSGRTAFPRWSVGTRSAGGRRFSGWRPAMGQRPAATSPLYLRFRHRHIPGAPRIDAVGGPWPISRPSH